jgi:glycosyltransferase involved in cell wall biosynthesis
MSEDGSALDAESPTCERSEIAGEGEGSDVSAVVLTIGESSVDRALESVYAQTPSLREIVVVRGVVPFHRALNLGASKVRSPFFVQVDADMVLDPDAVSRLRARMSDDAGIVVGQLRDTLIGRVVGVKLFRTACFQSASFPDSISPDTDFGEEIRRSGWRTLYIDDSEDDTAVEFSSLGEHRPEYTPLYTFRKYLLEGRRYRHLNRAAGLRWHFGQLEQSAHPCALFAQVAFAHGVFLRAEQDLLHPYAVDAEFERVSSFFEGKARTARSLPALELLGSEDRSDMFRQFHQLGVDLWEARAFPEFRDLMDSLAAGGRDERLRIAKIALCHGLFWEGDDTQLEEDMAILGEFLSGGRKRMWLWGRLGPDPLGVARAARRVGRAGLELAGRARFRVRLLSVRAEVVYRRLADLIAWWPLGVRRRQPASDRPADPSIGYLLWRYPTLSETFIRREIDALRRAGVSVRVFAAEPEPGSGALSEPAGRDVEYLRPRNRKRLRRYLVRFLTRRPLQTLNLIVYVVSRRYQARKTPRDDSALFLEAAYVAGLSGDLGIDHLHAPWADREAFIALVASRLAGVTYSVQARAYEIHRQGAVWVLPEKLRHARFVITNTLYNQRHLGGLLEGRAPVLHRIYNGVDPTRLRAPVDRATDPGGPRLLSVGRLVPKKGFNVLLHSVAHLRERSVEYRLDIVGDATAAERNHSLELRRLHARLGLEPTTHLVGKQSFRNVQKAYESADVFVLACVVAEDGDCDIIPNVIIEAMAMSLPVVSTPVGGIPELVDHDVTGLLVEPGDSVALADALERLLADRPLRRRMGRAGREKVLSHFDIRTNIEEYVRLFRTT